MDLRDQLVRKVRKGKEAKEVFRDRQVRKGQQVSQGKQV